MHPSKHTHVFRATLRLARMWKVSKRSRSVHAGSGKSLDVVLQSELSNSLAESA